jgi:serine protease inhibitor
MTVLDANQRFAVDLYHRVATDAPDCNLFFCPPSVSVVLTMAFEGARERNRINGWVARETGDQVRELLTPENVNEETRLALFNAVYFKGHWEQQFFEHDTREGEFVTARSERIETLLMHSRAHPKSRYAAFDSDGSPFDTPDQVPVRERASVGFGSM